MSDRPAPEEIILYAKDSTGLADAVNDNDSKFPPDFRLSKKNREKDDCPWQR